MTDETMKTHFFGVCPSGSWGDCPAAYRTSESGLPVMRCKNSNMHPDHCQNASPNPEQPEP